MSRSLTIAEALRNAAQRLRASGVDDAQLVAQSILAEALGCDRTHLIVNFQQPVPDKALYACERMLMRREAGEPLQYILGRQEFFGLEFEVTPDVLIPRPETELIIEEVVRLSASIPRPVIADIGTGSGCIAVTIARELPQAIVTASDISPAAIAIACRNAERHKLADRIQFIVGDLLEPLPPEQQFDFIASNPPYVRAEEIEGLQREVRDWEPRLALTDNADGLTFFRRLFSEAHSRLKPGGYLLCEMGYKQSEKVCALVDETLWETPQILSDLQGIPRTIALRKK